MSSIKFIKKKQLGYSTGEILTVVFAIGFLASFLIPNFTPAIEFMEVLLVEKKLQKAVRECQYGLINNQKYPRYSIPENNIRIGILKKGAFVFRHTGIEGECLSNFGTNLLSASKINQNNTNNSYSLIINLVNGNKTFEGKIPEWLDWWKGSYSPLIPSNDSLLD